MRKPLSIIGTLLLILSIAMLYMRFANIQQTPPPEQSATPTTTINPELPENTETKQNTSPDNPETTPGDYYQILGEAEIKYPTSDKPTGQTINYCEVDTLNRPVCAWGSLTQESYLETRKRDRLPITTDPAGWPKNLETLIPKTDTPGSTDYRGYFWNRSHLIADSLGGEPVYQNLITGTRTQNVGSIKTDGQYSGGMSYPEKTARDYLNSDNAKNCELFYSTTPQYHQQELIPRMVIVNIQSCDKTINLQIEVSNTANGFEIDYETGSMTATG